MGIALCSALVQKARMLIINDLTVRIAGRTLLEDASARITPGARVGLVGRNGTGKSTLFNVITGEMAAEGRLDRNPAALAHRAAGPGSAERPGEPARGRAEGAERAHRADGMRPRPRPTRIASPRSRPGLPISARTPRLPAPPRSCRASVFRPPIRPGPAPNFPAAGACASRSPRPCSPSPIC